MKVLSNEELAELLREQDYCCAICGRSGRKLAIDHDHRTGEVRGLICATSCNRIIGQLNEDVRWMRNAADYLEWPPSRACWKDQPRWWPDSPGAEGHDLREF